MAELDDGDVLERVEVLEPDDGIVLEGELRSVWLEELEPLEPDEPEPDCEPDWATTGAAKTSAPVMSREVIFLFMGIIGLN